MSSAAAAAVETRKTERRNGGVNGGVNVVHGRIHLQLRNQ